jgi:hypothetical protein
VSEYRQISVYIPADLHRWYRLRSVKENKPMSDLVREALAAYKKEGKNA